MSRVILLCGLPGSGKTTLGRALASREGYSFLEASDTAKSFFAREGLPGESYLTYVARVFRDDGGRRFASEISLTVVRLLGTHAGVIVSGLRMAAEVELLRLAVPALKVVFLHCAPEVRRKRKGTPDPIVARSIAERDQIEQAWHVPSLEGFADVIIDTSAPLDECLTALIGWLS